MHTKIFEINELNQEALAQISEAAAILRRGGLVAFPTETVYGLGADALSAEAVAGIYRAKGRPSDNPLIVHVSSVSQCEALSPLQSSTFYKLTERFWPGPLTLVLPKSNQVPDITTGGLSTIALRMPDDPVALELIGQAGCPVAAPSANLSGRPSPTKGEHVVQDMDGRVDVIIKSGDCRVGIESTVLDLTEEIPTILRPGILTVEDLEAVIGTKVILDPAILLDHAGLREESIEGSTDDNLAYSPKAPGMKYTHYAPKAEMLILRGPKERVQSAMETIKLERSRLGQKVGIAVFQEKSLVESAHDFFANLRELDGQSVDLILAVALNEKDSIGFAVMNRMLKAASYNVIDVLEEDRRCLGRRRLARTADDYNSSPSY
jgi:L-threonylcarbamoyladenylate synthase